MTDKDKTPVAGDIVTKCTKCKMELRHVVVAQNSEGIVAKVKCKTCGSEHRYYSDKKRMAVKKKKEKHAEQEKSARDAEEYARLIEQRKDKKVTPYSMFEKFNVDDIIGHKTFGTGVIIKVNSQKMDVLFETGPRILACNK